MPKRFEGCCPTNVRVHTTLTCTQSRLVLFSTKAAHIQLLGACGRVRAQPTPAAALTRTLQVAALQPSISAPNLLQLGQLSSQLAASESQVSRPASIHAYLLHSRRAAGCLQMAELPSRPAGWLPLPGCG